MGSHLRESPDPVEGKVKTKWSKWTSSTKYLSKRMNVIGPKGCMRYNDMGNLRLWSHTSPLWGKSLFFFSHCRVPWYFQVCGKVNDEGTVTWSSTSLTVWQSAERILPCERDVMLTDIWSQSFICLPYFWLHWNKKLSSWHYIYISVLHISTYICYHLFSI